MNALQLRANFFQAILNASKSPNYQSGNLFLVASEWTFSKLSAVYPFDEILPATDLSNPKLDSPNGVMQYLHKIGIDNQVKFNDDLELGLYQITDENGNVLKSFELDENIVVQDLIRGKQ